MKSPFWDWDALQRRIQNADLLALFLDFDGTLSRMVERPEKARVDQSILKALEPLSSHPKVRIAITSGRALADLRTRVPLNGVYLAGCHGLEISGPRIRFVHPEAERKRHFVKRLTQDLRKAMAPFPGAIVEGKGLSVAIHYRRVPESMVRGAREAIRRALTAGGGNWKLIFGKQVTEAQPKTGWNKGSCVTLLMSRFRTEAARGVAILPFYLGDDLTDQDGFDAVQARGVAIAVGPDLKLRADYRLKENGEVRTFLVKVRRALSSAREKRHLKGRLNDYLNNRYN